MENKKRKVSVIENKKAYHDYFIKDTIECGISLRGNEVKSLRDGKASIKESWAAIENGEVILKRMHITKWGSANAFDVDENRERKLLVHKSEIKWLANEVKLQGITLVPVKVYFADNGKCKVLLGLAQGKHNYDKRQVEKQKQAKRDIDRSLKNN